jgi:hypothetical protein
MGIKPFSVTGFDSHEWFNSPRLEVAQKTYPLTGTIVAVITYPALRLRSASSFSNWGEVRGTLRRGFFDWPAEIVATHASILDE